MKEIIERFNMQAHPEGGYYSETYRSELEIPGKERQLMTAIYFLIPSGHVSHFHRIKSDELWFFHSGSSLIVHTLDERGHTENHVGLDFNKNEQPQFLVKAGTIFGSSVKDENSYSFVSCVVAPGFDFRDFELFDTETLLQLFPENESIVRQLT
jgi:predicted cupin superfamily sugar epimerase